MACPVCGKHSIICGGCGYCLKHCGCKKADWWWIEDGALHFDCRIFCQGMGIPATPENQEIASQIAAEAFAKVCPGKPISRLRRHGGSS